MGWKREEGRGENKGGSARHEHEHSRSTCICCQTPAGNLRGTSVDAAARNGGTGTGRVARLYCLSLACPLCARMELESPGIGENGSLRYLSTGR